MPEKPTELDFAALGTPGLKESGGYVLEEWHPKLRGMYGPKMYREMSDNSSTIGAIQYLFDAMVRQVEWRVEPASPDPTAEMWAEFLESCLLDMDITFEDFISEVLSMLTYGWALFEEVYKMRKGMTDDPTTRSLYDDGKIGWRTLGLRAQDTLDRWEFCNESGRLLGMHQCNPYSGKEAFIPIDKATLFRTKTTKDNPEGRSIYRNAVNDYFFLKRISTIEAIGIERDMTGLLTMEVPLELLVQSASEENKALLADIQKMLSELKRDEREYAIIPPKLGKDGNPTGYDLRLLSTGGRRQIDTTEVKRYYKTNILQSVLAQFIQLGMDNVGSFALASSQTNLFSVSLGAYLGIITSTFNRYAVTRLMQLNGAPQEAWPALVHGDVEKPDLDEVGKYVTALSAAGVFPTGDEAIQRKLLEHAGLPMPEMDEGEDMLPEEEVEKHTGFVPQYHDPKTKKPLPHYDD